MEIEEKIAQSFYFHVAETRGLDQASLTRNTNTDDIGLDSMSLAQILSIIEMEFSIELQDEDVVSLLEAKSIGDYVDVMCGALRR